MYVKYQVTLALETKHMPKYLKAALILFTNFYFPKPYNSTPFCSAGGGRAPGHTCRVQRSSADFALCLPGIWANGEQVLED